MTTHQINQSRIVKKKGISFIWVLPIIAILLAGWLVFDQISNRGIMITIEFDSATGLEAGKTKVKYRGIVAGVVKKVDLANDLKVITATVEIVKEAKEALTDKTRFRLIRPEVSLSKISGLETLVSGEYIAILPSLEGEETRHYVALKKPPSPSEHDQGLNLTLLSDKARSIGIGSVVTYREFQVGEVYDCELAEDTKTVLIHLSIRQPYARLVKENSRFWNSSGVDVDIKFPDVSIRADSLFSMISGGISFYTPDEPGTFGQAKSEARFRLYGDFQAAQYGLRATIQFKDAEGLTDSTPVMLNGVKIGRVNNLTYDEVYNGAKAEVLFDPSAEKFLNEGTGFWIVKPEVSVTGVRGLDAIVKGNYISIKPGTGKPTRSFTANDVEPFFDCTEKGLMLCLRAKNLTVRTGAPILYKKVPVGKVINFDLSKEGEVVDIKAQIFEAYSHLVKKNTRFYNTGGVRVEGSLKGVSVEVDNLVSVAIGGISFFTPETAEVPKQPAGSPKECACYPLYKGLKEATNNGRLLMNDTKSLFITVSSEGATRILPGSPVLYKKIDVGEVIFSDISTDDETVRVHLRIDPEYRRLVKKSSRFFNASGIDFKGSLAGVTLRTESMTSLALGGISFFNPNSGSKLPATNEDRFFLYADSDSAKNRSESITITFDSADGLVPGALLFYKGIKLGQVEKIELGDGHKDVRVEVELFEKGSFVAKSNSRFWIVKPVLGIAGVENLSAMVTGNFLSVLPGSGEPAFFFDGLESRPLNMENRLVLCLVSKDLGDLKLGAPVYYKQIPVGSLTRYELDQEGDQVLITAEIDSKYAQLVRSGSRFWNVSGIDVNFGLFSGLKMETRPVSALLLGGIAFATPGGSKSGTPAPSGSEFTLYENYQE